MVRTLVLAVAAAALAVGGAAAAPKKIHHISEHHYFWIVPPPAPVVATCYPTALDDLLSTPNLCSADTLTGVPNPLPRGP